jgi:predicted amidophosphoribosyltransferase
MNEEPIKICSNCGAEYSPEALVCADCGGNLVFSQRHGEASAPPAAQEAEILVREGPGDYLEELGRLLKTRGIGHEIRFHGCAPGT